MNAMIYGVLLGGQSKCIISHGMQYIKPLVAITAKISLAI